ncbi:hypothetical protein [Gallaecimonas pentaromativorans]|nr:hypothetical protein [Gallaecimonas pentaromativorans]
MKTTNTFHAYLNSEDTELNESSTFSEMKNIFKNNTRVLFSEKTNPMTKKSGLKITVDDVYNISAYFDSGSNVEQDFSDIQDEPNRSSNKRLRVIFSDDPNNDFDDIVVILLDYMTKLKDVVVYNPTQEKIVFDAREE